jgi:hypothetical protein
MKTTRTILLTAVITATLFCATLFTACTKTDSTPPDLCTGVTCLHGGSCYNGICSCPSGYTGTYCEAAYNSAFAGVWNGTNCNGNAEYAITSPLSDPYSMTIPVPLYFSTACGGTYTVYLSGTATSATLFSTNTVTVSTVCGSVSINAVGQLTGNTLRLTLNLATNSGVQQCVFTGTH